MVNNIRVENILLPGTILYTGNTFNKITEMFDSVNVLYFLRTFLDSTQTNFAPSYIKEPL